jgi:diguanylate cyclase (GGDEF)-like protein/PAS domain S-box-containing protein
MPQTLRDVTSKPLDQDTRVSISSLVGHPETAGAPTSADTVLRAMLNGSFDAMAVIDVDCPTETPTFVMQNTSMAELRERAHVGCNVAEALHNHRVLEQIEHGANRVVVDTEGVRCKGISGSLSYSFTPIGHQLPPLELPRNQTVAESVAQDRNRIRLLLCIRDNTECAATFTALEESRRQLSMHVEQTPMAMIEWDIEGRVTSWNPAAERIFGYAQDDALGRKTTDLIFPAEVGQHIGSQWKSLIERQDGERVTNSNVRKDGTRITCEWYNTPLVDFDGRVVGVASMAQDVTDRIAAEREQQQINAELRRVMEGARCLVWHAGVRQESQTFTWNMHVTHDGCSTSWLPIFVPEGSTFQQAWAASIHPDDTCRMDARSRSALLSGASTYSQEFRCILADGTVQWLREVVQITPIDKGEWMLVGICTDITEQKTADISLSCERNQLRTLIDNLPSYIYFKDALGRFVIDNAAHARFLGASSPNDVIGHTIFDYIDADEAEQSELEDLTILETGLPMLDKVQCVHDAEGNANWYSTSKIPLCDACGSVIGLVGISHDITHQHQLEEDRGRMLDDAIDRADRDPLTGLLNHRHFHTRLAEIEAEAALLDGRYSVVIMDIDNFRFFNSAYGHSAGDEVLRNVASVIRSVCRGSDILARLGSDEFALILEDAGPDEVARFMARVEAAVDRMGYQPLDYEWEVPLSISSGSATFPEDSDSRLGILNVAGERLKTAKFGDSGSAHIVAHLRGGLSAAFENFSLLNALVSAVDNKDRYTRRHSEDVLRYSVQIATELGLDEQTMFHVKVAALLHDVGKIGVPDEILRKPGKLTDEEFGAIKQHPVMGAIMVHAVPGFEAILDAVRYHHERWDGNGYPDGLAGTDIPLLGRLMAVADAYSAMTTDRPYRKAMDTDRADQILLKGAGAQWDPACVYAFLRSRGVDVHAIA